MRQIKIKLDIPERTTGYYRLQEQWENEGGAIKGSSKEDRIPDELLPFTPGDTFRVISGSIDLISDHFYYIADIEITTVNETADSY